MNIEFVSYTGKHPNLCSGILTLKVDDKIIKFGHDWKDWDWKLKRYIDDNYDSFWYTGGFCFFTNNYTEEHIIRDKWKINYSSVPIFLQPYSDRLIDIFNDNVPYGCCGGCFEKRIELLVSAGILNSNPA